MKEFHNEILSITNANGKRFALIETSHNYIVACGYDSSQRWGQQWEHGIYYMFSNDIEKLDSLNKAVEKLREKVSKNYITRSRLEELATQFKDGLIEDDRESAIDFFEDICEMTDEEKVWFGIDENSTIANTKFENPMYNKGYDDGFSDAMNEMETE